MKKIVITIVITFICLCTPFYAFAHPGRTDANGGHNDRSNGTYHYHHGYPAHSHAGGVCPYDYDDQTEHSSSDSNSNSNYNSNSESNSKFNSDSYDTYLPGTNGDVSSDTDLSDNDSSDKSGFITFLRVIAAIVFYVLFFPALALIVSIPEIIIKFISFRFFNIPEDDDDVKVPRYLEHYHINSAPHSIVNTHIEKNQIQEYEDYLSFIS